MSESLTLRRLSWLKLTAFASAAAFIGYTIYKVSSKALTPFFSVVNSCSINHLKDCIEW